MSKIVIVAGDGEYNSDVSMRAIEGDLRMSTDHEVIFCTPDVLEDAPEFPQCTIEGLEQLADADLLIIYTRFRRLADEQMEIFRAYRERRGPMIGLRTSSHAFHFPEDSPWEDWNDGFGAGSLGTRWITHHGHASTTDVTQVDGAAGHPVLAGVESEFAVRSWLYVVDPAPDCVPLLHGEPRNTKREPQPGPVAWVREANDEHGRIAFTTLGHQADFGVPSFRQLLSNAVMWCLQE